MSHALLHCTNDNLRAARVEAWEGKDPGSNQVLLNNPRWERRLLRFLELSGAGRLVEGEDVERTRAARMDRWIAWGRRRGSPSRALRTFLFFPSVFPFERAPSLELCAPRMLGSEDFFGATLVWFFFLFDFFVVYISLRDERRKTRILLLLLLRFLLIYP